MIVRQLEAAGFRNLAAVRFEPGRWNLILGANAQGKTNLLEALHLLGHGRSFRTRQDRQLIGFDAERALVSATLEDRNGLDHRVAIEVRARGKRCQLDGRPVTRLSSLLGVLPVVIMSGFDHDLVRGAPVLRRQWLDRVIGQSDSYYLHLLVGFHRLLLQRNELLRRGGSEGWFEALDGALANLAVGIWEQRERWLGHLATEVTATFAAFFGKPRLGVRLDGWGAANAGPERREKYLAALKNGRQRDIIGGFTHVGPHRDDMALELDDRDVRTFGSTGQQKALALSLQLGAARLMARELGEAPVIGLDDIFSELDQRFSALVREMIPTGTQVFETGVLGEQPVAVPEAAIAWRMVKGELLPWKV